MSSKPKQWVLADKSEKFLTYRYEAPEGSDSALSVNLRWSVRRELYVAFQSNAIDGGAVWISFARPIRHHAVAKRQAFEMIAWSSVPLATVHQAEEATK
jgi:hypothetical protein